jgi:hypothetical protein
MNVEEFLKSDLVGRRSKISAFDSEIRQLRVRGVSGQGIANFLKLNNVQVTKTAVNQYFKRYPVSHPSAKPVSPDQVPTVAAGAMHPPIVKADHPLAGKPAPQQQAEVPEPSTALHSRMEETSQDPHGSDGHSAATFSINPVQHEVPRPSQHLAEISKAHEKPDVFNPRPGAGANYDVGAGFSKSAEAIARSSDQPRRSPLIRFDPKDPKNIAAKASYLRRLKEGQIRTGEITNSQRNPDETQAQETPDPS